MQTNTTTLHPNTVEFEVWGNLAMFSDIITKVGGEKMSYPVPTYEALKGILQSIYWKPTFMWIIDDVRIMNPIRYERHGMRPMKYNSKDTELAYYTYLEKVRYQVRAHFEWNKNRPEYTSDRRAEKHLTIAKQAIELGGRRDIFLGVRECQAYVKACTFGEGEGAYDNCATMGWGVMEHGFTYPDEAIRNQDKNALTVRLWMPTMDNGVIHFPRPEDCTMTRRIKSMSMKKFELKKGATAPNELDERTA